MASFSSSGSVGRTFVEPKRPRGVKKLLEDAPADALELHGVDSRTIGDLPDLAMNWSIIPPINSSA